MFRQNQPSNLSATETNYYQLRINGASQPLLGNSVTIPAGSGGVTLLVEPLWNASWATDGYPSPKDVTLQLLASSGADKQHSYSVGFNSEATVSVQCDNNWIKVGDWTTDTDPRAKALTDHDSLNKLAWDITGCEGPWPDFGPIKKDTEVPVKLFLQILEQRLRDKVVEAAGAGKYATFGRCRTTEVFSTGREGVDYIFTMTPPSDPRDPAPPKGTYDCEAMQRV